MMKHIFQPYIVANLLFFLALLLFATSAATAPKAPISIAGIRLGGDIDDYPDVVRSNFMRDVVVTDWHGFRKGIISYGECKYKGQILKIDMKYGDKSREFFEELLKRYKSRFGEPQSWEGDSFGVMRIWKWSFTDDNGDEVSLTLQYNGKNSRETIGNMVRLSFPKMMEEERNCFNQMCQEHKHASGQERQRELEQSDWSHLIPE